VGLRRWGTALPVLWSGEMRLFCGAACGRLKERKLGLCQYSTIGTDCSAPMRSCSLKQFPPQFITEGQGLPSLNSRASSAVVTALLKTVHAY